MKKVADAYEQTTNVFISDKFKYYEYLANHPDKLKERIATAERNHKKIKAKEIYKKHRLQKYILQQLSDTSYVEILWRTCPHLDDGHPVTKNYKEKIGKYYYKIHCVEIVNNLFARVFESQEFNFDTLKELKIGINNEFVKYGYSPHYKVKTA